MSILITGMKMPKDCHECQFVDILPTCPCQKMAYEEFWENVSLTVEVHKDCPIAEVPDGHWVHETGKIPKCSVCGKYSDDADTGDAKFCPFCGARMDGE